MKRIVFEIDEKKKQSLKDLAYLKSKKSKKEVTMKELMDEATKDLLNKYNIK